MYFEEQKLNKETAASATTIEAPIKEEVKQPVVPPQPITPAAPVKPITTEIEVTEKLEEMKKEVEVAKEVVSIPKV